MLGFPLQLRVYLHPWPLRGFWFCHMVPNLSFSPQTIQSWSFQSNWGHTFINDFSCPKVFPDVFWSYLRTIIYSWMEIPMCWLLPVTEMDSLGIWSSSMEQYSSFIVRGVGRRGKQSLLHQPILKESCVFCTMYRVWHLANAWKTYKKQAQQQCQTQGHHSGPKGDIRALRKALVQELGIRLEISVIFYCFSAKSLLIES